MGRWVRRGAADTPAIEQLIGRDTSQAIARGLVIAGVAWFLWTLRHAMVGGFREIMADPATGPLRRPGKP